MLAKTCLAAALWIVATDVSRADGHLTVAMDRDRHLFVSTTLDREAVHELSFGLDQPGLRAFETADAQRLGELAAASLHLDVTIWVDPNARPMGWPAGWRADSDLLDPSNYVLLLLIRARERAGLTEGLAWRLLPVPFPPRVPLRVGGH
jgi:hypothetical protein